MTLLELILSEIPKNYQRRRLRRHFPQTPFAAAAASAPARPASRGSHIWFSKIPPQAEIFMKNEVKKWLPLTIILEFANLKIGLWKTKLIFKQFFVATTVPLLKKEVSLVSE